MRRVLNPHETPVGYHPLQKQHVALPWPEEM